MGLARPLMLAISLGGQVLGAMQERNAISAQISAERQAQDFRNKQAELDIKRSQTEASIRATEREKELSRALAAQKAQMAGAVELTSGSPLRLQEATTGTVNRQQSLDDFALNQNILNINVSNEQSKIGSQATVSALKTKKRGAILDTAMGIGQTIDESGVFKKDG